MRGILSGLERKITSSPGKQSKLLTFCKAAICSRPSWTDGIFPFSGTPYDQMAESIGVVNWPAPVLLVQELRLRTSVQMEATNIPYCATHGKPLADWTVTFSADSVTILGKCPAGHFYEEKVNR